MNTSKIRYYAWYFLGMALCAASLHALPGDINGDGVLDVADLVRVQGMIDAKVAADNRADCNFDGVVDEVDLHMLEDALRGVALPLLLVKGTIGAAGGTLEHAASGFRLELPAGALATTQTLALAEWDTAMLEQADIRHGSGRPLLLYGLPAVDGAEISLALPAGATRGDSYALAVGNYTMPRSADAPGWHFQLMNKAEDGVSVSDGRLRWRPQAVPGGQNARRAAARPEPVAVDIVRDWLGGAFYESTNFRLQMPGAVMTDAMLDRLGILLGDLEFAYQQVQAKGFTMDARKTLWGSSADRIKVVVKHLPGGSTAPDGYCNEPGYWSPPFLELNTTVLNSANRLEIASHEFFHYVQYMFANNTTTVWLDDLSATWLEGQVSAQGSAYTPNTYKNPRAPINGLYRSSWRFGMNHANDHGYSLSVFATYLSKHPDWPSDFWYRVFSHASYKGGEGVKPMVAAAKDMGVLGLEFMYQRFLRDYLSDKSPFSSGMFRSIAMYGNIDQNEGDWQRYAQNGKTSKITKPADISGKLEQAFSIQDMGAATWLFTFPKPKELISDGVYMRVEVDDVCNDLFAVLYRGPEALGVSGFDSVKRDEQRKKLVLDLSLNALKDSDRPMSIGVVAVNADNSTGDSPQLRPVTMTVQYLGLVNLPVGTTYFSLFGERVMQATADLELRAVTPGVLGEYSVSMWPGAEGVGPFPELVVQMNKAFPQTVRVHSIISPVDFGDVHGKDNVGFDFSCHMVPTQRVLIEISEYPVGSNSPVPLRTVETTIAALATKDGVLVELAPTNPDNEVAFIIRPVYTGTGLGAGLGENLWTLWCLFMPSEGSDQQP